MISCNPDVGCTVLDHGQNGGEDTTYSADLLAAHICGSGHGEKMPEQFIGAVNQMHVHAAAVRSARDLIRSISNPATPCVKPGAPHSRELPKLRTWVVDQSERRDAADWNDIIYAEPENFEIHSGPFWTRIAKYPKGFQ